VERDPIERVRRYLTRRGDWNQSLEDDLRTEVDGRLRLAVAAAEATRMPPLESLHEDVFAELSWNLEEQRTQLLGGARPAAHRG
jgi:TPP-dependent pyruvate/acetoin dehydrogenase alpha subunit